MGALKHKKNPFLNFCFISKTQQATIE